MSERSEFLDAKLSGSWNQRVDLGFDKQIAKTWDNLLHSDHRLLVPIDVQALVVRRGKTQLVAKTASVLPVVAGQFPTKPQPFGETRELAGGAHLHWAMPDGLMRGNAGKARKTLTAAGNPAGLPTLPDRWIVVRLQHGGSNKRCWILEADTGDRHPLEGWTDPGARDQNLERGSSGRKWYKRLVAAAGGDLTWAASYESAIDRFGFHDDWSDLPTEQQTSGVFTYLVAGWWSDRTLDPLHGAKGISGYVDRALELGWDAPEPEGSSKQHASNEARSERLENYGLPSSPRRPDELLAASPAGAIESSDGLIALENPPAPALALLHGTVFGVRADGEGPDQIPAAASVELAIGGTAFSALAAMIAEGTGDERLASERAITAFSSNLLSSIDKPGGLAAVDEERHASCFIASSGGERKKPDVIATGDPIKVDTGSVGGRSAVEVAREEGRIVADVSARLGAVLLNRDEYAMVADFERVWNPRDRYQPRGFRTVNTALPRFYQPTDPVLVLRGAGRSLRHNDDGRHDTRGLLPCRLPREIVRGYKGVLSRGDLPSSLTDVASGAVPPEVDHLLSEAVLIDPYRSSELARWARERRSMVEAIALDRFAGEMVLRYPPAAANNPFGEPVISPAAKDQLLQCSVLEGVEPSPIGRVLWAQPWVPLWVDAELSVSIDDQIDRWKLDMIDLGTASTTFGPERSFKCRMLLSASSARALSRQIKDWLSEEDLRDQKDEGQIDETTEDILHTAARASRWLDVLHGSFEGLRAELLGLDPNTASMTIIDPSGVSKSQPLARALPQLLAAGRARLSRVRVVDAFGRFIDLPRSNNAVSNKLEIAATHADRLVGPHFLLKPRFQAPARLFFRFVEAKPNSTNEARVDQQDPPKAVSPIAGWLLPDHVDEALEFFDAAGKPLGQLLHDPRTNAVVWEDAPGTPGPMGLAPNVDRSMAARIAHEVIGADAAARRLEKPPKESALSALLRAIDTTSWLVDPLGAMGTEAIAGLVGRPIAVVRATIALEVTSDVAKLDYSSPADREARTKAFAELASRAINVRIGELTRVDDGLLGYLIESEQHKLHVVSPDVRSAAVVSGRNRGALGPFAANSAGAVSTDPIDHPCLSDTALRLHPNHTVSLLLLMAPGSRVHATCGVVPRKHLALARDWMQPALDRLSPSFRVGPVLVDPTTVRLPKINGLGPKQTFIRRTAPLDWREDAITAATKTAYLPEDPHGFQEGWIRVQGVEEKK